MPEACPECGSLLPRMEQLRNMNEYLQGECSKKDRQLQALRADRRKQPEADPLYAQAKQVFEYWVAELAPKAREFSGTRAEKVIARLRAGYTVAELKQAVDGCKADEWHMRRGKIELEYICRDEGLVQRFIRNVAQQTLPVALPVNGYANPSHGMVSRIRDAVFAMEYALYEEDGERALKELRYIEKAIHK